MKNWKPELKIDIVIDKRESISLVSTAFRTTNYIKECVRLYPSFKRNIIFLKYIMGMKSFDIPYKGGMNSYSLSLLYIAFLECTN